MANDILSTAMHGNEHQLSSNRESLNRKVKFEKKYDDEYVLTFPENTVLTLKLALDSESKVTQFKLGDLDILAELPEGVSCYIGKTKTGNSDDQPYFDPLNRVVFVPRVSSFDDVLGLLHEVGHAVQERKDERTIVAIYQLVAWWQMGMSFLISNFLREILHQQDKRKYILNFFSLNESHLNYQLDVFVRKLLKQEFSASLTASRLLSKATNNKDTVTEFAEMMLADSFKDYLEVLRHIMDSDSTTVEDVVTALITVANDNRETLEE